MIAWEERDAARFLSHVLPQEEESREAGDVHRLDFGAEAVERVSMDAREQSAIAPLVRSLECAAQNRTLRFEREERGVRFRFGDSQRFGERSRGGRAGDRKPAAKKLDDRIFACPR